MLKTKNSLLLVVIFILSFLIRFMGLGFSNFYGDETKVFYLDKTVPAIEFFMNQRKGPVQFFVAWVMEKVVEGPDELYTRVPFALAGFLSVIVFYFLAKKLFNEKIALISTIIFAFNGFNVAFSRIVQYQSFLILFGLLALYLFIHKKYLYSAISLGLAFLSHYDAIFFLVPLLYFIWDQKIDYKKILLHFVLPLSLIVGIFYIPYIYYGYFESNTLTYLSKRLGGSTSTAKNYSAFTIFFYNPCFSTFLFLFAPILLLFKKDNDKKINNFNLKLFLFWFVVTFLVYQFFITNPGTHIHNYLIPLYFLSGYTVFWLYEILKNNLSKKIYLSCVYIFSFLMIIRMFNIFVPQFSTGYPWNSFLYKDIYSKYQLYVYGFPYNKNWKEIRNYFISLDERVSGVFTNDDDDVAMFYLSEFNYTRPGTNFLPQYYIDVKNSMSFLRYKEFEFSPGIMMSAQEFYSNYEEVYKISNDVVIYKKINLEVTRILGLNL